MSDVSKMLRIFSMTCLCMGGAICSMDVVWSNCKKTTLDQNSRPQVRPDDVGEQPQDVMGAGSRKPSETNFYTSGGEEMRVLDMPDMNETKQHIKGKQEKKLKKNKKIFNENQHDEGGQVNVPVFPKVFMSKEDEGNVEGDGLEGGIRPPHVYKVR